ncbi:MAG: DNA alkylation repair protein [Schleiferiaceae bacterium]|jgi:3-methyladenine DNA glycosylase AlkC|nr:DNA alkylation repair protein [Schleiferiaceae bacterium]
MLKLPEAPNSIQKGVPLKEVLNETAIRQIGHNLNFIDGRFDQRAFVEKALKSLEPLSITQRGKQIAMVMAEFLPQAYPEAIDVILKSLTPPLKETEGNGLAPMFYWPHCYYIAEFGLNHFDLSMQAQYELTQRFTCEFSIRPFINKHQDKTLDQLKVWMKDDNPHVRRLCSEGTRPRLPWATKIDAFVKNPSPVIPILEKLKNDPNLYVRRSVANHVGDIAKDHTELALSLCEEWVKGADKNLKWVIRHSVRNLVKKGNIQAIELRVKAK